MRKYILLMFFLSLNALAFGQNLRVVQNLNFGWLFYSGKADKAYAYSFDDSQWQAVDIPHDFQIEQPWVAPAADEKADNTDVAANIKSRLSSRGFKEMGQGWYRLHLTPADSLRGRRLLLDFGGIAFTASVYLNGEHIGGTDYGYVGFEIDVTDKLKIGHENVIAVLADTRQPENSRWYTGGGIFRDVKLISTPRDLFFNRHPLYVTTRDNRFVSLSAEFTNRTRKPAQIRVRILDPEGEQVYEKTTNIARHRMARTVEVQLLKDVEITKPKIWTLDNPALYTAVAEILNEQNQTIDQTCTRFGIRTIEFGPTFGMRLNGQKVLLKGYANHHTLGALGAAAYPRAIEKRIQLMKQFGINHIRTSHNPYSREFIELCDQYGILVVDELYDKWTRQHTGGLVPFENLWQKDIPEWIKRDRNSPSVVLWSLGNELQQDPNMPYNDFGVTMYQLMRPLVNRYDSTRKVTVAMHPRYRNWETDSLPCDLAMKTDVQAYNYRYMYFPGDGRRFPWMTFYQSEASVAAMGQNYFEMDLDRVIGLAYWGAIDYLGESQGWPAKGWSQGVFDISLQPKPKAYFMKSFFKPEEPLVHIGIIDKKGDQMWNGVQTGNDGMSDHWNRAADAKIRLYTYTNAEEVELILNGRSLGTKKNASDPKHRNAIYWSDITYQPGYLEAVARNNGQIVARHRIETTSKPSKLMAKADNHSWKADGIDLQHVDVALVDTKGRCVQTADNNVTFSVEGDARIIGVVNGDICSDESMVGNQRRLYNGKCTVILRAGRVPGKVVVKASAEGFKPVRLNLTTENITR